MHPEGCRVSINATVPVDLGERGEICGLDERIVNVLIICTLTN